MRLLNTNTFKIEEFYGKEIPKYYAILSHTWGEEELSFQDWSDHSRFENTQGFIKISGACNQARKDDFQHIWVDTICIDKTSSAELSEAINSMYDWYSKSSKCYAYLEDVLDHYSEENKDISEEHL